MSNYKLFTNLCQILFIGNFTFSTKNECKREKMKGRKNAIVSNLYELGNMVKLNKGDIDSILENVSSRNEQISISLGPPQYPGGGFYGSISIYDFFYSMNNFI